MCSDLLLAGKEGEDGNEKAINATLSYSSERMELKENIR